MVGLFILSACGSGTEVAASTLPSVPPVSTDIPSTETHAPIPFTDTPPAPAQDPALFGAIGWTRSRPLRSNRLPMPSSQKRWTRSKPAAPFRTIKSCAPPSSPGAAACSPRSPSTCRTADPAWFAEGGTPAADDWINNKCSRFDFVSTETEYQLKNRRLCN